MNVFDTIQHCIMLCAVFALCVIALLYIAWKLIGPMLEKIVDIAGSSYLRAFLLCAFAFSFVYYGATKGKVSFPYTDIEKRYIVDNGSYVTNDLVHINFSRMIAPTSADLHIDYRQWLSTDDDEWTPLVNTTFANFQTPQDIPFPAATNYNFAVYTTWTPGAAVQTNGVWHCYWGLDRKLHIYMIPVRTAIRVNGETIATPKSKENANHE